MKNYIVYDSEGNILKTGQCREEDLSLQGELVIEGIADDAVHKIENGQVVDKIISQQEIDQKSESNNRAKRDRILGRSDWTQVSDSPLSEEKKTEYQAYRQALRDLPTHANWPNLNDEDWPVMP
jgi:hypothetical protein